ncbi:MAG: hypothetical protein LPK02_07155 [Rhodobacterales bacterium]|nr:hypothetical protein [Rhodobacterales bacterium]
MQVETRFILGCRVIVIEDLGHAAIEHGGGLQWDHLQHIKNVLWGEDAVAIEVYPPTAFVINNVPCRHLWRLGKGEFWPDLLGRETAGPVGTDDTLQVRWERAWLEAEAVFMAA